MAQAPPQFAKKSDEARGGKMEDPRGGAKSHLDALESLVKTARGRAALNTLRSELSGDGDSGARRGKPSTSNAKAEALERFGKQ